MNWGSRCPAQRSLVTNGRPFAGVMPWALTDKDGHVLVHAFWLGEQRITAAKEEDGYPNAYWEFYTDKMAPSITSDALTPRVDGLVVTIGPKAGILAGSISAALSNKPLAVAFHLWRDDNGKWIDASEPPEFRTLIPAGARVGISIHVDSYQDWNLQAGGNTDGFLVLTSGETKRLDIKLTPKGQPQGLVETD